MRAVRYHGPKQPLQLEEVPAPTPEPGEVVVQVKAAGLCHTELHFLSGLLDLGVQPVTLGATSPPRAETARTRLEMQPFTGALRCANRWPPSSRLMARAALRKAADHAAPHHPLVCCDEAGSHREAYPTPAVPRLVRVLKDEPRFLH